MGHRPARRGPSSHHGAAAWFEQMRAPHSSDTAAFFGSRMCEGLGRGRASYSSLEINYMPGRGGAVIGAGRRTKHARDFARSVARIVKRKISQIEPSAERA